MGLWQRTRDVLIGAAGPTDAVISRGAGAVHLRLPDQRFKRNITSPFLVIACVLGPAVIIGTILDANADEKREGSVILLAGSAFAIVLAGLLWRVAWHYEIALTPAGLRVECFTTFYHRRTACVDMTTVGQLTVVRTGERWILQAETPTDAPQPFLWDESSERMRALANLLANELMLLAPERARLRVAVEDPHRELGEDRVEQPISSQVELTHPATGITLDFPLPEDERLSSRRKAWRAFEVGIVLLLGAVLWYALCTMADWQGVIALATLLFIAGIGTLIGAANTAWLGWQGKQQDDDLRQLSVVGNMLIRTSRDHRKKAWYRAEIRTVRAVVGKHETTQTESGNTTVEYYLTLNLELFNGETIGLFGPRDYNPHGDYRPKAEFEWIATKVRLALFGDSVEADVLGPTAASTAIQEAPSWIKARLG